MQYRDPALVLAPNRGTYRNARSARRPYPPEDPIRSKTLSERNLLKRRSGSDNALQSAFHTFETQKDVLPPFVTETLGPVIDTYKRKSGSVVSMIQWMERKLVKRDIPNTMIVLDMCVNALICALAAFQSCHAEVDDDDDKWLLKFTTCFCNHILEALTRKLREHIREYSLSSFRKILSVAQPFISAVSPVYGAIAWCATSMLDVLNDNISFSLDMYTLWNMLSSVHGFNIAKHFGHVASEFIKGGENRDTIKESFTYKLISPIVQHLFFRVVKSINSDVWDIYQNHMSYLAMTDAQIKAAMTERESFKNNKYVKKFAVMKKEDRDDAQFLFYLALVIRLFCGTERPSFVCKRVSNLLQIYVFTDRLIPAICQLTLSGKTLKKYYDNSLDSERPQHFCFAETKK